MPSNSTTGNSRPGFFYVVQPFPELSPHRIKFGWTLNVARRLKHHRCAAPTARVFAAWPCPSNYEHLLVQLVVRYQRDCKRVGPETYDIGDLVGMHRRIERCLVVLADSGGVVNKQIFLESLARKPKKRRELNPRSFADPTADTAIENVDSPPVIETGRVPRKPSNRRSLKELLDEYWAKNPLTPYQEALLDFYVPLPPTQDANLPNV